MDVNLNPDFYFGEYNITMTESKSCKKNQTHAVNMPAVDCERQQFRRFAVRSAEKRHDGEEETQRPDQ